MITIPKKKCDKVNCNNLINFNERYCNEHKELINQSNKDYDSIRYERDRLYVKFYNSKAWREVRHNTMLRNDFLCSTCLAEGKYTKAYVVDHIVELKDDWSKRLDSDNLEPLCHYHHNIKTIREKQKRRDRNNKQGEN